MRRSLAIILLLLLAALPVTGRLCDASCERPMASHHHHSSRRSPQAHPEQAPQDPDRCGHDHVAGRTALVTAKGALAPPSVVAARDIAYITLPPASRSRRTLRPHRPPDLAPPFRIVLRV